MSSTILQLNAILTILIAVFGALGNALIIYVFMKIRSLRTVNNALLCILAIVDLTKAVMILLVKAYTQLNASEKYFNLGAYCQVSGFITAVTVTLSALLLAAISIVRYYKVVRTRYYDKNFTKRRMVYYCVGMFAAVFLLAILPLVGAGEYSFSIYHGVCFTSWARQNLVFRSIFYLYTIGLCYPVVIYCYTKIFIKLRRHNITVTAKIDNQETKDSKQEMNKHMKETDTNLTEIVSCLEEPSQITIKDQNTVNDSCTVISHMGGCNLPQKEDGSAVTPKKDSDTLSSNEHHRKLPQHGDCSALLPPDESLLPKRDDGCLIQVVTCDQEQNNQSTDVYFKEISSF